MSIPRSSVPVNTPLVFANEQHADADQRQVDRAERLAMTKAQMVIAAENRYNLYYESSVEWQGGVGYVECIVPEGDRSKSPWIHLLPIGKNGDDVMLYLVRGTGAHYGSPDWHESENMREWLTTDRDDHAGIMTEVLP